MNSDISYYSKKLNAGLDLLDRNNIFEDYESLIFDFEKTCGDVDGITESVRKYRSDKSFMGFSMPGADKECLKKCCSYLEKHIRDLKSADAVSVQNRNTPEIHIHNTNNNESKSTSNVEVNVSVLFNQTINTIDSLDGLSNTEKKEIKRLLEELKKNNSNTVAVKKIINYMKKGYQIAVALSPLVSQYVPNLHLFF
ncbi:hypothetical protein MmiHf6_03960 [Methanimicrococcus hongohii]|uniref:Uncharacterized protein n=1 Tax=Methanimicrococcus hongohii TaxID=3028295 RepID=A0AA96UYR0_9EURY|nr:hypothetical protein [Methanimicrococcus sp. Hf6]WNY23097.1 hypothetical protein MmiHf6_03960 [Methanimicrococcus sp. Hf6]